MVHTAQPPQQINYLFIKYLSVLDQCFKRGGRIIDNRQIDNQQIDNLQIDNKILQIDNRQIDNLQIAFIS